jgi:hypothetical protein
MHSLWLKVLVKKSVDVGGAKFSLGQKWQHTMPYAKFSKLFGQYTLETT